MHESQLVANAARCSGSCEPSGQVQETTLAGPIGKALETITFDVFLGLIMGISGLLQPFTIISKESNFFFHKYVYKFLIWVPKFYASKHDKTMSK